MSELKPVWQMGPDEKIRELARIMKQILGHIRHGNIADSNLTDWYITRLNELEEGQ